MSFLDQPFYGAWVEGLRDEKRRLRARPLQKRLGRPRDDDHAQGYQSKLYTLQKVQPELVPNYEKEFFAPADTQAERTMHALGNSRFIYSDRLRVEWAKFISGLLLRCPEDVTSFRTNFSKYRVETPLAWEERYATTRQPHDPATLAEKLEQVPDNKSELRMFQAVIDLIENENVLTFITQMKWSVIDTGAATQRLLTSDRPVVRTNGLNKSGGHIVLAIGPTKLFAAAVDHASMNRIKAVPVSKLVRQYNQQVVQGAARYVYADDRSQMQFVEKHLATKPQPRIVDKFFNGRKRVINCWIAINLK